ncbi:alpha/beta hydrolase [Brevundimonas sp. SORGH_AS_0993]|uniref:alpha/beta hydrolase n=1 Tax=Brevundimonas sp. SORGH_AS_0993 TaxID=3041794 RepID=UPI00278AC421|nr:alpha/beta hydrolase [Brevundimonas sp. SORGH_AS_0993]MDQ1155643.1 acetyl esterase/lipase [Brevundimonas sp. SORGH_AS_0993]
MGGWIFGRLNARFVAGAACVALTVCGLFGPLPWSLAQAQAVDAPISLGQDDLLQTRRYALRPGDDDTSLTLFAPQNGRRSGAAVIIAPGGGYVGLAGNLEGRQVADWFAARGVTAFVLQYRYGARHPLPQPIEDGERAVRFVRANARAMGLDPDRIGLMGFSAGGHLAAMTVGLSDAGDPAAVDAVERVSSRPDFLVLAYPWLEATTINAEGGSEYCRFAARAHWDCRPADFAAYTPLPDMVAKAPPTFIYHTTDDALTPVRGSVALYSALATAGKDVEMHLFAHGSHGSGMGGADPALSLWPQALEAWLRARGYFSKEAQPAS